MTTVTSKRVDKLYVKLSPEQLGTLAFEACIKGNDDELEKIKCVVPRKNYLSVDAAYEERADKLYGMVNFVGFQYWRHWAYYFKDKKNKDRFETWLEHVANLITFARRVCEKTNADFDLIMEHLDINEKIIQVIDAEAVPADEEKVNDWLEMMAI